MENFKITPSIDSLQRTATLGTSDIKQKVMQSGT
jgi:hypothetical protein